MRQPQNFDPEYVGKWVAEHTRQLSLHADAIVGLRRDMLDVLQKQANMVHYCISGFHVLVEKGLLTNEEILSYLQANSTKSPEEVLVDAGITGNEADKRCDESGVLSRSGDFGNQTSSLAPSNTADSHGVVDGQPS